MKEKEFWGFLNAELAKGRMPMVSGRIDSDNIEIQQAGQFIGGHSLLPENYEDISLGKIIDMGKLLLERNISYQTKEAIMILLAHHGCDEAFSALKRYNLTPDRGLEMYAKLALDECEMWNED